MPHLYSSIRKELSKRFSNFRKTAADNIADMIIAMIDSGSFSTHQMAESLARETDTTFHCGENRIANFLKSNTFFVGDKAFRNLINLLFDTLAKRGFLDGLRYIPINIDYTGPSNLYKN